MKLHGIELAKPDEWYIVAGHCPSNRMFGFIRIAPRKQIRFAGWEWLDLFVHSYFDVYSVTCGVTGQRLGVSAESLFEAAKLSKEGLIKQGQGVVYCHVVDWLETHPLSPRYRYTGGG